MLQHPSANDPEPEKPSDNHYLVSRRRHGRIEPLHADLHPTEPTAQHPEAVQATKASVEKFANPAVKLIRNKLETLYGSEPDAQQELKEAKEAEPRTKHQQFMYDLSTSGRSLADIQTAWHNYYVDLPDAEKHEVWEEFYTANAHRPTAYSQVVHHQPAAAKKEGQAAHVGILEPLPPVLPHRARDRRTPRLIKKQILDRVSLETQEKAKRHFKSLLFGLGTGILVLAIFLFGFFNEVVVAPFIQPSRQANATPIILNNQGVVPTDKNEIIIPKINLQIPLDFSVTNTDEGAIERSLDSGVVHYPTTSLPGEQGNTAFFGHSSNNIFNKGRYKFAFVLLRTLVPGDIFYLTYNGKAYTYRVFDKRVVEPREVSVLNPVPGKLATATLITCDPPGTSLHRLVVWGEQVSPDPAGNAPTAASQSSATATQPQALPADGPTLWGRFIDWLTN